MECGPEPGMQIRSVLSARRGRRLPDLDAAGY
jgi:hypothetical protein